VSETSPLGYARGVLDELRARHENLSREELLELVCTLTKEYVLDQTIPFDFPMPERAEAMRGDRPDMPEGQDEAEEVPSEERFARLISGLKARTGLPQLENFSIEAGKAVLVVDNQKVVFGERVTVSLFSGRPRRGTGPVGAPPATPNPGAPSASAPSPGAPSPGAPSASPSRAPAPSAPAKAPSEPERAPMIDLDDDEDVDYEDDSGVERFGGLDLD